MTQRFSGLPFSGGHTAVTYFHLSQLGQEMTYNALIYVVITLSLNLKFTNQQRCILCVATTQQDQLGFTRRVFMRSLNALGNANNKGCISSTSRCVWSC